MLAHAGGCGQRSVQAMTARDRAHNSLSHLGSGPNRYRSSQPLPARERIPPFRGGRRMIRRLRPLALMALATGLAANAHAQAPAPAAQARTPAQAPAPAQPTPKPQTRPHGQRVPVDIGKILVDDGDTVSIVWGKGDVENVRILGIDTPETRHLEHNLPYPQDFGPEARGFAL